MADETLNEFLNPRDPETLDQFGALQEAQQNAIGQHQAYTQKLEGAQQAVAERQSDIAITQRFFQILDPSVPKVAKGFLYNETARELGTDPKGQSDRKSANSSQASILSLRRHSARCLSLNKSVLAPVQCASSTPVSSTAKCLCRSF